MLFPGNRGKKEKGRQHIITKGNIQSSVILRLFRHTGKCHSRVTGIVTKQIKRENSKGGKLPLIRPSWSTAVCCLLRRSYPSGCLHTERNGLSIHLIMAQSSFTNVRRAALVSLPATASTARKRRQHKDLAGQEKEDKVPR